MELMFGQFHFLLYLCDRKTNLNIRKMRSRKNRPRQETFNTQKFCSTLLKRFQYGK